MQAPTNNNFPGETYDPSYCSVKLPTPQPLAPMDSPVAERYFFKKLLLIQYHFMLFILKTFLFSRNIPSFFHCLSFNQIEIQTKMN